MDDSRISDTQDSRIAGSLAGDLLERAVPRERPYDRIRPDSPDRFFNRELSWLSFNDRVLEEAYNEKHPLLERLRFLSISGSNLDEFFMVRVAGLYGQVREGIKAKSQEGLTPAEQLALIDVEARKLMAEQQNCWRMLRSLMEDEGVFLIDADDLTDEEKPWLERHFIDNIFPILTPLTIDPAHPFPFIPNLGFVLCFDLEHWEGRQMTTLIPVPIRDEDAQT